MVWRQFGAFYTTLKYLALFLALLTKFLALLRHFDLAALVETEAANDPGFICHLPGIYS